VGTSVPRQQQLAARYREINTPGRRWRVLGRAETLKGRKSKS
jgi:hypothetical protein